MGKKKMYQGKLPESLSGFLAEVWQGFRSRKRRQSRGGAGALMLCLLLMLALPVCSAYAAMPAERDGLERVLQLRIKCMPDAARPTGMIFNLYYLAYSEDGGETYTVVDEFAGSGVDSALLGSTDSESRGAAIRLLAAYINANKETVTRDASAETVNGEAVITGLAPGYYLCASNTAYTLPDGTRYTPVPFLFEMKRSSFVTDLDILNPLDSVAQGGLINALSSDIPGTNSMEYAGVVKFAVTRAVVEEEPAPSPDSGSETGDGSGELTPSPSPANPDDGSNGSGTATPGAETGDDTPGSPASTASVSVRRGNSGGGGGSTTGGGGTPLTQITPDGVPAAGGGGGQDTTTLTDDDVPLSDEPTIDILDDDVPLANIPDEDLMDLPEDPVPLAMMPQTGLLWWPVPIMLILGLFMAVTGWAKRRK